MKKDLFTISMMLVGCMVATQGAKNDIVTDTDSLMYEINDVEFNMIHVAEGSFLMGAQGDNSKDRNYDLYAEACEAPVHRITLSSYYIGETEVTQGLWTAVGMAPSCEWTEATGLGKDYPAYNVNVIEIRAFLDSLNTKLRRDGKLAENQEFVLPTEAQWEFAAKGGNKSNGYKYAGSNTLADVAWSKVDNKGLQPVKSKAPNELGIYDMSGNVYEVCADKFEYNFYKDAQIYDPYCVSDGMSMQTVRGGSWYYYDRFCRTSSRFGMLPTFGSPDCGFRLALVYKY